MTYGNPSWYLHQDAKLKLKGQLISSVGAGLAELAGHAAQSA
jgi:hypothetical protein